MFKKIALIMAAILVALTISSCTSAADRANENLSKACENFECPRRIVGINTITDTTLFSVEGYCSYEVNSGTIEAICATEEPNGQGTAVSRTTLGQADNVTFVSTQLESVEVDFFRPRVIFRPENVVPNFDLATDSDY